MIFLLAVFIKFDEWHFDYFNIGKTAALCHEIGHALGLPDLYTSDSSVLYNLRTSIVGKFDIMSETTNPPNSFSAYSIYKYLPAWRGVISL